jgi:hypothetical protein
MVGLGAVDNTSDLDKPISTATQTALNNKQPLDGDLTSIAALSGTFGLLKKTANNSYTIDTNTYLTGITSSDVTTALGYTPENVANKGVNNGYASLGGDGKVPSSQLPSYVDDVIEVSSFGTLPATGETGKIYITLDTNKIYRWSGSVYVEVSSSAAVWGGITGTLSAQTDLQNALNAKENTITAGTTAQYYRGDKTFQTLDTSVVPEGSNLYFTDARVNANGNVIANTAARHNAVTLGTANGLSLSTQELSLGVASGSTTGALSSTDWTTFNNKYPASNPNGYTSNLGTVTSVALTVPSAFSVSGSPITSSGTLAVTATGDTTQYIAGDGSLVTFPTMSTAGTLIREVRNTTGATLTKGTVVYISGATGNKPTVSKAIATGDATSAQTFGIVQANIAHNANGNVVCVGDITGLDTSAFDEGTQLYLSSTTAGTYTSTKQLAPNHLVYIGVVTRQHNTQGQIEVNIQNGYELYELHDVSITSEANNQGLFYEASTDLWKNKSIATVLGYTPANDANVVHTTGNESISGTKTFTTSVLANLLKFNESGGFNNIPGYTQIGGTADNFIFINGAGTKQAQFIYNSGGGNNYTLPTGNGTLALTSDLHNAVTIGTANGLSLSTQVLSLGLASTSTTGALSSTDWNTFNSKQNALTNPVTGTGTSSYLPKFTGTTTIGNSLLYDTGSVLLVGATSASDASSKLELVSSSTVGLKIISSGANGNNTFLSIESSKEWRFLTNRGDLIGGNQGDLIIRNNTDGINHIILNQGGSTTFAGSVTANGDIIAGNGSGSVSMAINRGASSNSNGLRFRTAGTNNWYIGSGATGTNTDLEIYNHNTATSNIRIDYSTGNVGIGTTSPSARLDVGYVAGAVALRVQRDANNRLDFYQGGGVSYIDSSPASAQLAFATVGSERMRITSGGNVGIGTTAPSNILTIKNNNAATNGIDFQSYASTSVQGKIVFDQGDDTFNFTNTSAYSAGGIIFKTNSTERMRISSSGKIITRANDSDYSLTMYNSASNAYGIYLNYSGYSPNSTNYEFAYFSDSTNSKFIVWSNGSVINRTGSYGTISDIKFKENIVDATPKLGDIAKLKVRNFNLKGESTKQIGFIAQEFEEVFPNMVDVSTERGEDGETYKSIKTSVLIPMLVKSIQELNDKVKTLENK